MADVNANIGVNIDSSQALAQLKVLQKQISDFNLSIAKSNEAAALAQKSLQKNLVNSINAIGSFSAELRTVSTTAESFTKALENNKLSMRDYFRYAAASTKTFGQSFKAEFDTIGKVAEERVKTLQTQYIKMGRDANGAMKAIAVRPLALDMDNLATKTQIAAQKQAIFNQLMKQGSTNLLNFGKNTQWAGRQLMVGFTLPLMAFGAAASKSFQQLETEVIKFKKVYGDLGTSKAQTDQALNNIKRLADGYTKYGVEVSKTVEVASAAAAAGFQNADLIAQTDAATKLAILGQIDQQQALQTTISLQNAFKISSKELASTIDFLNAVENQTVTSLDDITTAIPKVAPVINSLGGDVKDLAFFLTAMKEGGVNASEGANALKSGLASLINPTKKAKDMLGGFGINVENIVTKNRGNLKATVIEFAKALDTLDPLNRAKAIETMFGKFQFARISTLLSNVTQTGTQAAKVLDLAGQSAANLASLTSKELGITAESALVRFQAAMAKLRASLAPVGEVFMKAFTPVIDFVTNILDKFNNLSDGTKKAIAVVVGVIGGLGPILLMTFGLLANGVANIIKLFMTLRTGFQRLTGQSQNLGEQTAYLTSEQLDAAAAAHSLEQSHARLTQQFTVEAGEVNLLRIAYERALAAGSAFALMNPGMMRAPKVSNFADGGVVVSGPGGPKDDMVPANLSNGEVVLSVNTVKRNRSVVAGLLRGGKVAIPGYAGEPGSIVGSSDPMDIQIKGYRNATLYLQDWLNQQLGSKAGAAKADVIASLRQSGSAASGNLLAVIAKQLGLNLNDPSVVDEFDSFGKDLIGRAVTALETSEKTIIHDADLEELIVPEFRKAASGVKIAGKEVAGAMNSALDDIRTVAMVGSGSNSSVPRVPYEGSYRSSSVSDAGKQFASTRNPKGFRFFERLNSKGQIEQQFQIKNVESTIDTLLEEPGPVVPRSKTTDSEVQKALRDKLANERKSRKAALVAALKAKTQRGLGAGGERAWTPAEAAHIMPGITATAREIEQKVSGIVKDSYRRISSYAEKVSAELTKRANKTGKDTTKALNDSMGVHSPSDDTKRTGREIDNGLIVGMEENQSKVIATAEQLGEKTTDAVNKGAKKRRFATSGGVVTPGTPSRADMARIADAASVAAVSSIIGEGEIGKKARRYASAPQGPAPIGPEKPIGAIELPLVSSIISGALQEGFTPTSGISKKMIGPMTKNQARWASIKSAMKPKLGLDVNSMKTSVGLMVGSMALNALPEFTGKALMQSSMNMAAMGAMFGPWGAAAGAAIGLVSAGISKLLDKERKQKAMQEAVFKSSGDLATFFGNSVVDTDGSLTHFNVTLGATTIKAKELSSSFGFTSAEIKAFKELLASLPENNPLNQIITGLTNEKNPERISKIAKAFITTQVALGQIKPDQAQKTLDLFLSASNHAGMIGSTFIDFKDQTVAVVKTLKAAALNADAFGTALVNLIAAASNSTSLAQMQAILDGIAQSGINGANALNALQLAYLGLNNTEAARGIDALRSIKGMNASNIAKVMTAVNAGLKLDLREEKGIIKDKAYVMKLANDYLKAKGTYGMQQGKADPEVQSLQAQNMSLEDKVKLLEEAKKKIDERLKKEQQISNELKRQNDYLQSQQDIEKKIIDAKLHGNYIEAALLSQQKLANTAQYNYDTKIAGMQSESDALAEKISKLKDTQDTNTTALNNLTSATNTLGVTINNWDPGKIISDAGKSKAPIPVPGTLGLDFGGSNRNLGSAGQTWSGWGKWSDRELIKKYATEMKYAPGTHFYTQTGNAKDHTLRYDEFVVLPDGNIERVKAGLTKPPGMQTGGYVKHYEPGGKVSGPGTGTSDSIPAMLSNGEYVFSAKAVQAAGGPAVVDSMHQALRAATGGHILRGKLSASHMSSSKINKEFERKLIEHGVRSLPSKVTEEMINALSGGSYKKGSLAGYQSQALALMSDRDMAFKIAHLNDATSSLMPNWNLPYDLANQARMMKGAGRSKSFIRSMLGLSNNVYVPGKYADGGYINGIKLPVPVGSTALSNDKNGFDPISGSFSLIMSVLRNNFNSARFLLGSMANDTSVMTKSDQELMKQFDKNPRKTLNSLFGRTATSTASVMSMFMPWESLLNKIGIFMPGKLENVSGVILGSIDDIVKGAITSEHNDKKKYANGGIVQHFGGGGMPNVFGMGMNWFGKTLFKAGNSVIKNIMGFDITKPFNKKSNIEKLSMALLPFGGEGATANAVPKLINPVKASTQIMRNLNGSMLESALAQGRKVPIITGEWWKNTANPTPYLEQFKDMFSGTTNMNPLLMAGDYGNAFRKYWGRAYEHLVNTKDTSVADIKNIDDFFREIANKTPGWGTQWSEDTVHPLIEAANKAYMMAHGLHPEQPLALFKAAQSAGRAGYTSVSSKFATSYLKDPHLGIYRDIISPGSGLYKIIVKAASLKDPIGLGGMYDEFANVIPPSLDNGIQIGMGTARKASRYFGRVPNISDFYSGLNIGKRSLGETYGMLIPENIDKIENLLSKIDPLELAKKMKLPKFHSWNGTVPGPYGQELNAVLKSGTEGVYQNDYIRGLKREALGSTTTSNANTVYNIDMTVNGGNANASEIADQVMRKIKTISSQNNKSNKVMI